MMMKTCLLIVLGSILTQQVLAGYINLHECIQNKCFSLYTYCQKEPKCKKSYQLVNLCSQINPDLVGDCIDNIHNYLHIALQTCLTNNCGYKSYYQTCGITNSKIRNCIDVDDSDCYLNNGGKEFKLAVEDCQAKTFNNQCGSIPTQYTEYRDRCTQLNLLSCYQSSLSKSSQTIQDLFQCSSQILKAVLAIAALAFIL